MGGYLAVGHSGGCNLPVSALLASDEQLEYRAGCREDRALAWKDLQAFLWCIFPRKVQPDPFKECATLNGHR